MASKVLDMTKLLSGWARRKRWVVDETAVDCGGWGWTPGRSKHSPAHGFLGRHKTVAHRRAPRWAGAYLGGLGLLVTFGSQGKVQLAMLSATSTL